MYKENWTHPWLMGSEIYPEVHENPRAFFSNSSSILLEPLAHGSSDCSLPREDCINDLLSENLGHNGLLVLHLSIPPEHFDKLWVYHLRVTEITMDSTEKQSSLYVEVEAFQHTDTEVVFNLNNRFSIDVNDGCVSGDNSGCKSSIFTGV